MCCLFRLHCYRAISVYHYDDTSWSKSGNGSPSTVVTLQCLRCGRLKRQVIFAGGYISLESLIANKEDDADVLRT